MVPPYSGERNKKEIPKPLPIESVMIKKKKTQYNKPTKLCLRW
jgi:hypothetical protein